MGRPGWRSVVLVTLLVGAACSTDDDDSYPPSSAPGGVEFDVDLGGSTIADVFEPGARDEGLSPIVVMLHGTAAERSRLHDLARRVAADGVLVYVPSWPVIDQAQGYPDETDEPYRQQAEVVVCALRHIRRTSSERGGDPDDLTVFGHSGGALVGAQVAMVSEPPWPGIDCDAGTSHAPQRFIGSAGDYNGRYQLSGVAPAGAFDPYDPTSIEPTNTDLEVRLIHGLSDDTLGASESSEFLGHVLSSGLDAELISTDSGHGEMIDPSTPAGEFVAEQVVALATGAPSALEILSYEGVPLAEPPDFVDSGGLELVDQPGSETIRLLFLEGDQRWVLACVPVEPPELRTPEVPRFGVVLSPAG
jgi:dienelactone hydrolase